MVVRTAEQRGSRASSLSGSMAVAGMDKLTNISYPSAQNAAFYKTTAFSFISI